AGRSGVVPVGPPASPAADDDGDHAPERGRRWLVPTAVGLAGVAVGSLVGIGLTLSAQGEAQRERAEAQRVQSEVAAEREQLESERADLDAQRAELDAATAQLTKREEAVAQAEEDASKRSQELDDRQKEQDEREQEERPGNGPGNGGGNGNDGGDGDGGGGGWDWGDWGCETPIYDALVVEHENMSPLVHLGRALSGEMVTVARPTGLSPRLAPAHGAPALPRRRRAG
ncbi:hypothetical protein OY671_005507, partial [Metschnikowia pulcherrima]